MKKTPDLPSANICRIRKISGESCECLVKDPVSCRYVRVDNKALYCLLHAPPDLMRTVKFAALRPKSSDPRFKARVALYSGQNLQKLMSDYSVDISTGGLFIVTADILPVGTPLKLKFKFPDYDEVFTCTARVAWVNESGHAGEPRLSRGVGLQFIDLSLRDMHVIRDCLTRGELLPTW